MFEKFQVNGYDKENDVVVQLTTSNLAIALNQYKAIQNNCNNGNLIDADTGEVYMHFSFNNDNCGVTKTEWANSEFVDTIYEIIENEEE